MLEIAVPDGYDVVVVRDGEPLPANATDVRLSKNDFQTLADASRLLALHLRNGDRRRSYERFRNKFSSKSS